MALSLNIELTRSRGIFSSHRLQEYLMRDPSDPSRWIADTSKSQLSWDDIYKFFFGAANYNEITGNHFGGSGVDFSVLITLLGPCCVYLVFFMALRFALREPLARLGMSMGVVTEDEELHKKLLASGKKGTNALSQRNQKRIFKFQNQVWLFLFYSGSAIFGWYVQRDKPWFTLPMNDTSALHMLLPHPYNPSPVLIFYYQYGLAFYTSELISLMFLEKDVKRSDYMEYFLHHLVTLALMVLSHVGWLHRFGVYVLFIHDASDIMLSLSKALHYVVEENNNKSAKSKHQGCTKSFIFKYLVNISLVNFCMVLFVISFFYFRLWCLPSMVRADVFTMPLVINCNYNTVGLTLLLNGLLQALHIYWAALIIKVFLGMFYGVRKDVRSASEEEVEEPNYVLWNGASPIGAQSNSLD